MEFHGNSILFFSTYICYFMAHDPYMWMTFEITTHVLELSNICKSGETKPKMHMARTTVCGTKGSLKGISKE